MDRVTGSALALLLLSGCYVSASFGDEATAEQFGVFTFGSCTGSGFFEMITLCEEGTAATRAGAVGEDGRVDTAGWSDAAGAVEVRALRGGLWTLTWNEARGTWCQEDPIECARCAIPLHHPSARRVPGTAATRGRDDLRSSLRSSPPSRVVQPMLAGPWTV
jgi:hypothetical protein